MELSGKVIRVFAPQQGVSQRSGNPWMSQEFVVETPGQYPRQVCFKLFGQDKVMQFNIAMGELVTVSFDIEAHEHNGRFFNNINAWDVKKNGMAVQVTPQSAQGYQPQPVPQPAEQHFPPQVNALGMPDAHQQMGNEQPPF